MAVSCSIRRKVVLALLRLLARACLTWGGLAGLAGAAELPEYQLKAALLYNFALFTEWPAEIGPTLSLCVMDGDKVRREFDEFQGQAVGNRRVAIRHLPGLDAAQDCQVVYLPKASVAYLTRSMQTLAGRRHVLTVGDSPEAEQAGVAVNMAIQDARVVFDVNLQSLQDTGLILSSKLLRLAQHVR